MHRQLRFIDNHARPGMRHQVVLAHRFPVCAQKRIEKGKTTLADRKRMLSSSHHTGGAIEHKGTDSIARLLHALKLAARDGSSNKRRRG